MKKPPQPVNDGILTSSCKRILAIDPPSGDHIIVSIENGLIVDGSSVSDVCLVVISCNNDFQTSHQSFKIDVPIKYYNQAVAMTSYNYELGHLGLEVTVGEMINKEFPDIDPKNWMASEQFGNIHRINQILDPLFKCLYDYKKYILKKHILQFDNFPKDGVIFKDLSKIFQDPILFRSLIDYAVHRTRSEFKDIVIDKVVGLDARGFIFGPLLALGLNAGFVMARKKGKLPGKNNKGVTYGTEYSQDSIEIMDGIIQPGDNVLIVDDLVATGGSLDAAKRLVQLYDGIIVGACCILKVDDLYESAKEKLNKTPIIVILD